MNTATVGEPSSGEPNPGELGGFEYSHELPMGKPLDIAIIGLAGCYAGAGDARQFWQNILGKVDAVSEASPEWVGPFLDPEARTNDRVYTIKGGFLHDLAKFDPLEFGIMPSASDGGEPDHMLALRFARDALADARYLNRDFNRARAGVVIGRGTYANRGVGNLVQHGMIIDQTMAIVKQLRPDFSAEELATFRAALKKQLPPYTAEMVPMMVPNVITGLIANRLDLMGPNYLVDAACASSIVAVDSAIRELASGRSDLMLTGGVQAQIPPQLFMHFCQLGALSHGDIRPFQKGAAGTLLGEGCGVLVLKRLADAERDGDRIYAVIKGVGVSSDGRAKGLLAPRFEGEVLALRRAYGSCGIDPRSLGLVEAHGTATAVGDRTEIAALAEVFGPREGMTPTIAIGSVKSMISHCIPASGSASLIKAALALHHKILPPTLCDVVEPGLGIERTPFYVNNETRPWIHGAATPRRAGVSAFGFGGVNTHVVLEEYRPKQAIQVSVLHAPQPSELIMLAAPNRAALLTQCQQIQTHIKAAQSSELKLNLAMLAKAAAQQTASCGSDAHRLALVADNLSDLAKKLDQAIDKLSKAETGAFKTRGGVHYNQGPAQGKVCWLYPGEGAQYPDMLADVCLNFPQVREWFDFFEHVAMQRKAPSRAQVVFPVPTGLDEETRKSIDGLLYSTEIAAESVSAASLGLTSLLDELGMQCDAILGHSTGENTALVASQVRHIGNREDIAETVRRMNRLYGEVDAAGQIVSGTLMTVGALKPEAKARLVDTQPDILVAMDNCPNQIVLFGAPDPMRTLQEQLSAEGAICAPLPFGRAYHTPLFKPIADAYRVYYRELSFGRGRAPLYSACGVCPFPEDADAIRELAALQWEAPVRFTETLRRLYDDGVRVFIEVGPSGNLTSFVGDTLRDRSDIVAVATNSRRKSGIHQLQASLAQLFAHGVRFAPLTLFAHRDIADYDYLSEPKIPRRPMPHLNLQMPFIRPPEGLNIRPLPTAEPTIVVKEVVKEVVREVVKEVVREVPVGTAPANAAISTPIAPATAPLPADPRMEFLGAHFALMQEFLDGQMRVLGQLNGTRAPAPWTTPTVSDVFTVMTPPAAGAMPNLAAPLVPLSPPPPGVTADYPLLGRVTEQMADRIVIERRYQHDVDLFIRDHAIGAKPSDAQPELRSLLVIPFTFSMEIVSEAAQKLLGAELKVVGMEDVRGHRWLTLDQGSIDLRITADRITTAVQANAAGHAEVKAARVRIFLLGAGPPNGVLVYEATLKLAATRAPAPAPMPWNPVNERPNTRNTDDSKLYDEGMFHGPRLQCVKHIRRWAENAVEADLEVIPTHDYFSFTTQPKFLVEAAMLDAVGQLAGYWQNDVCDWDYYCFPYRIGHYEQYCDPLPAGSKVIVRAELVRTPDSRLIGRFDLIGPDGRVAIRIESWEDRNFPIPRRFHDFRMRPQTLFLSQPLAAAESAGRLVRRVEPYPEHFLDTGFDIWKRIFAHMALSAGERQVYYSLPPAGTRREEWLMGRMAAKDALRLWVEQRYGRKLAPADFEILPDEHGQPVAQCVVMPALQLPSVSISHSDRWAAAAVSAEPGQGIGVDYQRIGEVNLERLLQGGFNSSELHAVHTAPAALQTRVGIALWAAKESAAKSTGHGLLGRPLDWRIVDVQSDPVTQLPQRVVVEYQGKRQAQHLYFMDDAVLAICEQPSPDNTANAHPPMTRAVV